MRINEDESRISGDEFKVRRFAIGLDQNVIGEHLNVQRAAIDKWQRGLVPVPRYARELLESIEHEVEATIEELVHRKIEDLEATPYHGWPWGQRAWFYVISRARYLLSEQGVKAVIHGETRPPPKER